MYLRKRGHVVPASWKLQVVKQLAYALNYLVSVPCVHRGGFLRGQGNENGLCGVGRSSVRKKERTVQGEGPGHGRLRGLRASRVRTVHPRMSRGVESDEATLGRVFSKTGNLRLFGGLES